jgi:hypothetical protein
MGKGAKKEERLQELEEINHNIQAENAELRRLLQVAEEEKQELQERSQLHGEVLNEIIEELQLELQTKDDLLAKLQHGERMEDKEPSIVDAQTQTEVYDVSSCSMFSQYETNVGMKLLTKMGYKGGGLGIHGQGITQPLEVVQRPRFTGLGYGKEENGECSKVVEEKTISSPSDSMKGIKPACPHQSKNHSGKYKGHFNSFLTYEKDDYGHRSSNHDVAKDRKKKTWVEKTSMPTGSGTKKREPLSRLHDKEILLKEKRRNYCTHCEISGHWEKKCWKLHPEIRQRPSNRQIAKTPTKKEATKIMEHVINVPAPVSEEMRSQKEGTFDWLGKKWISFLHSQD